jgi:nucleotide-binding universal stress UspA family protein
MFSRIVLGYAGDRAGRDAAVLAAELACRTGAKLTVAFPYHPLLAGVPAAVAEERLRSELAALLGGDRAISEAECHWSNASWPTRALHELAEFGGADLIVLGAAPERLERRQVGLMGRIVHGAPCAVAVAPDGYAERPQRGLQAIGVGFTDSAEARAAVALGVELAHAGAGELRVIAAAGLSPSLAGYALASPSLPLIEDELYTEARVAAEQLIAGLPARDGIRLDLRRGDPCRVLVEASRCLELLVLGSRAYGPVRHALLGGVSAPVMRESNCPVLVLPRGAVTPAPGARHAATSGANGA